MTRSSDDILADLLAECSELIIAGGSVQACLDQHPQHATELEPLLSAVVQVRGLRPVPARSTAAVVQGRAAFMAAAYAMAPAPRQAPSQSWGERIGAWWQGLLAGLALPTDGSFLPRSMPAGLMAALLIVILTGVLTTGVVATSAHALPGDLLYPVKTAVENVQVLITRDPEDRGTLLVEQANRRVDEAREIVKLGRPVLNLALQGTIEALTAASGWSQV